jgi:hypothetical protein
MNTNCYMCNAYEHGWSDPGPTLDDFTGRFANALVGKAILCTRHLEDGHLLYDQELQLFMHKVLGTLPDANAQALLATKFEPSGSRVTPGCCFVGACWAILSGGAVGVPTAFIGGFLGTLGGPVGSMAGGWIGFTAGTAAGAAAGIHATRKTYDPSRSLGANFCAAGREVGATYGRPFQATWRGAKRLASFCCPGCRQKVEEEQVEYNGQWYVEYKPGVMVPPRSLENVAIKHRTSPGKPAKWFIPVHSDD